MGEFESIISAVRDTLESVVEVNATEVFPSGMKKRYSAPVITVGIKSGEGVSAGLAEYIGEKYYTDTDAYAEIYGKRLELTLAINIYSPLGEEYGYMGCMDAAGKVITALTELPSGIKVRKASCNQTAFDEKTGMYLCPMDIECVCFMYAEKQNEEEFLDFTLKGVLSN